MSSIIYNKRVDTIPASITDRFVSGSDLSYQIVPLANGSYSKALANFAEVVFSNGLKYKGGFDRGFLSQNGRLEFPNGEVYEGGFAFNRMKGKGTYTWPNGSVYEGDFEENKKHGKGSLYNSVDQTRYVGDFSGDQITGRGRLENILDGTVYEGEFVGGSKEGKGKIMFKNGDFYEGNFKNNQKDSSGTLMWASQRQKYSGEFRDNKIHGYGKYSYFDSAGRFSNSYTGEFCESRREGSGLFNYRNGLKYVGGWARNMKEGIGETINQLGVRRLTLFRADKEVKDLVKEEPPATPSGTFELLDPNVDYEFFCGKPSAAYVFNIFSRSQGFLLALFDQKSDSEGLSVPGFLKLLGELRVLPPAMTRKLVEVRLSLKPPKFNFSLCSQTLLRSYLGLIRENYLLVRGKLFLREDLPHYAPFSQELFEHFGKNLLIDFVEFLELVFHCIWLISQQTGRSFVDELKLTLTQHIPAMMSGKKKPKNLLKEEAKVIQVCSKHLADFKTEVDELWPLFQKFAGLFKADPSRAIAPLNALVFYVFLSKLGFFKDESETEIFAKIFEKLFNPECTLLESVLHRKRTERHLLKLTSYPVEFKDFTDVLYCLSAARAQTSSKDQFFVKKVKTVFTELRSQAVNIVSLALRKKSKPSKISPKRLALASKRQERNFEPQHSKVEPESPPPAEQSAKPSQKEEALMQENDINVATPSPMSAREEKKSKTEMFVKQDTFYEYE